MTTDTTRPIGFARRVGVELRALSFFVYTLCLDLFAVAQGQVLTFLTLPVMPKVYVKTYGKKSNNTVYAKDEPLSLIERIDISKETREKYKDVCKIRRLPKPRVPIVQTHAPYPGHMEDYINEMIDKAINHRLVQRTRTLVERLASPPAPLLSRLTDPRPLADRIADHIDDANDKYPELPDISFKKKFRERRIQEHLSILEPTIKRLEPVFRYLDTEEAYQEIVKEDIDAAWLWFNQLQDLSIHMEKVGHQWKTNKPWRDLKGICKRIGKVDMKDLNRRLKEVAKELIVLNPTVPSFTLPSN